MKRIFLVIILLIGCTAWADDFEDGMDAYDKKDYATALKKFRLAAEQGNPVVELNIGYLYSNGQGVAQDYKEALKWYRLAAAQIHINAQLNLGMLYANGAGTPLDYLKAYMWWSIASNNGHRTVEKSKNELAARMTQQQIAKAKIMANECEASNYKNCD